MKHRITLSIDPAVTRRAKKLAYAKRTSVSALVEQFLRSVPMVGGDKATSFVERWAGKFTVARMKTHCRRPQRSRSAPHTSSLGTRGTIAARLCR